MVHITVDGKSIELLGGTYCKSNVANCRFTVSSMHSIQHMSKELIHAYFGLPIVKFVESLTK